MRPTASVATHPETRLAGHSAVWLSDVTVVTLEHYWSETALRFAETEAIHTEHPRHNLAGARPGKTVRLGGLSRLAVRQGIE
jgi:hypothetical protein